MSEAEATKPEPRHEPDGALDAFMARIFGRSWRTSCAGLLALLVGIVAVIPGLPPQVTETAKALDVLLIGGGLMLAKDSRISGLPK